MLYGENLWEISHYTGNSFLPERFFPLGKCLELSYVRFFMFVYKYSLWSIFLLLLIFWSNEKLNFWRKEFSQASVSMETHWSDGENFVDLVVLLLVRGTVRVSYNIVITFYFFHLISIIYNFCISGKYGDLGCAWFRTLHSIFSKKVSKIGGEWRNYLRVLFSFYPFILSFFSFVYPCILVLMWVIH